MKRYLLCGLLSAIVAFTSCKKEEAVDPTYHNDSSESPYTLVSTSGSWWVYQWYSIDSTGTPTSMTQRDSVYIVGDTAINGNTYIHAEGTYLGSPRSSYYRDSSGYIVNSLGNTRYNYVNIGDTIYTQVDGGGFYTSHWFTAPETTISVPAGTFDTHDFQGHFYSQDGSYFTACDSSWIQHSYYADGIGEIASQTAYLTQITNYCTYMERRLVSYHIEP